MHISTTLRKYSADNCIIYLQVMLDDLVRVSLKIRIREDQYDKATGMIVNHPKAKELNLMLRKKINRANDILIDMHLTDTSLSPDVFKQLFKNPDLKKNFITFMENEVYFRLEQQEITYTSFKQHKVCLSKIRKFKSKISFAEITASFINEFDNWHYNQLKNDAKARRIKLKNQARNTRNNHLKIFKCYFRRAVKKFNLQVQDPWGGVKIKYQYEDRVFLNQEELKKLITLYRSASMPEIYERVLRSFLFMCLTGIRISDMRRIKECWIDADQLNFVPRKTEKKGERVKIPLSQIHFDILYKDDDLLQVPSEQRCNKLIKELARKAGIKKEVSNHVARHTFATVFLENGGTVEVLKELLGHSDIKTTQVYTHITDKSRAKQMQFVKNLE